MGAHFSKAENEISEAMKQAVREASISGKLGLNKMKALI